MQVVPGQINNIIIATHILKMLRYLERIFNSPLEVFYKSVSQVGVVILFFRQKMSPMLSYLPCAATCHVLLS